MRTQHATRCKGATIGSRRDNKNVTCVTITKYHRDLTGRYIKHFFKNYGPEKRLEAVLVTTLSINIILNTEVPLFISHVDRNTQKSENSMSPVVLYTCEI